MRQLNTDILTDKIVSDYIKKYGDCKYLRLYIGFDVIHYTKPYKYDPNYYQDTKIYIDVHGNILKYVLNCKGQLITI